MRSSRTSDGFTRTPQLILAGLLLLFAGLVIWFGQTRPIDADEGFYAAASGLVSQGQTPYEDFFYPQSPLLPRVYGPLVQWGGHHLKFLRLGSSLLAILAVIPWLLWLTEDKPWRLQVVLAGAMLLLIDPHLLSWNVTVKSFALSNLLISWSLYFLHRGLAGKPQLWLAAAGLAAGLVVSTRALYAPLVLVLGLGLAVLAFRRSDRSLWWGVAAFAAGCLVGLAPLLTAWIRDADLFWFNNITCHQIRYSQLRAEGLGSSFGPRAMAALSAASQAMLFKPYRLLMLILALIGWIQAGRNRADGHQTFQILVLAGTAVFFLTNLLPDPVQQQYFTGTMGPLMFPAAVLGLARLAGRFRRIPAVLILLPAIPLAWSSLFIQQDGINPEHEWTWSSYEKVCALLEERSQPNDLVVSFWPGYVFETGRRHLPGMENHFAVGVSENLSAAECYKYHIVNKELLAEVFQTRRAQLVILGVWMNEINTVLDDQQMAALLDIFKDHYCLDTNHGRAKLALPCAEGGSGTLSD